MEQTVANAPVQHADDIYNLILSIAKSIENEQEQALKSGMKLSDVRSGMHTTNVTGVFEKGKIVVFRTGLHHAGEILAKILNARAVEEEVVIIVDASLANTCKLKSLPGQRIRCCKSNAVRTTRLLHEKISNYFRQ